MVKVVCRSLLGPLCVVVVVVVVYGFAVSRVRRLSSMVRDLVDDVDP